MMYNGKYDPLTLDEAVSRSADVLEVFLNSDVECIRIGLCESENLHSNETYVAGPSHPSMGELVYGEIYYKKMCALLEGNALTPEIKFSVARGETSKAVGQKKRNITRISSQYGIEKVRVVERDDLSTYTVVLS
jgi:histone acetyltransferase (RNA polymerase elongator complex component)